MYGDSDPITQEITVLPKDTGNMFTKKYYEILCTEDISRLLLLYLLLT